MSDRRWKKSEIDFYAPWPSDRELDGMVEKTATRSGAGSGWPTCCATAESARGRSLGFWMTTMAMFLAACWFAIL